MLILKDHRLDFRFAHWNRVCGSLSSKWVGYLFEACILDIDLWSDLIILRYPNGCMRSASWMLPRGSDGIRNRLRGWPTRPSYGLGVWLWSMVILEFHRLVRVEVNHLKLSEYTAFPLTCFLFHHHHGLNPIIPSSLHEIPLHIQERITAQLSVEDLCNLRLVLSSAAFQTHYQSRTVRWNSQ